MTRIAEMPYDAFVRPDLPVIPPDSFGPEQHEMMEHAMLEAFRALRRLRFPEPDHPAFLEVASPRRTDFRFFVRPDGEGLAIATPDGSLAGGVFEGTAYVLPAHRRRGLGTEVHLLADEHGWALFDPEGFSPGGRGARTAAHREAVLAAVAEGRPVHPENLERYAALLPQETGPCCP